MREYAATLWLLTGYVHCTCILRGVSTPDTIAIVHQGFPKLTKSCSHFSKILPTTADIKSRLYRK